MGNYDRMQWLSGGISHSRFPSPVSERALEPLAFLHMSYWRSRTAAGAAVDKSNKIPGGGVINPQRPEVPLFIDQTWGVSSVF